MYVIIWEFHVKEEHRKEFERAYNPDGDWAALFGKAEGYLGTDFLRDAATDQRYLTIDRWLSKEAYETFRKSSQAEYEALDRRTETLIEEENCIGSFHSGGIAFPDE